MASSFKLLYFSCHFAACKCRFKAPFSPRPPSPPPPPEKGGKKAWFPGHFKWLAGPETVKTLLNGFSLQQCDYTCMTWYVTVPGASTQWNEPVSTKHLLHLTASEQFHKHICSFTDLFIPKSIGLASKPFIYLAYLLHKLCVAQAKQGVLLSARF